MRSCWQSFMPRASLSGRVPSPTQSPAGEKGGSATGPNSVDRARNGSNHHLLVDARGIPLAWRVTGGNRNDVTQLIPLVDAVPPVRGRMGGLRRRPERLTADRGYDYPAYRRDLRQRGIRPKIARRHTEHGSGLGRARWVVERTFAWLHKFKRLLVRDDRRHEIHEAFLALACCLVCFRRLQTHCDSISYRDRVTGPFCSQVGGVAAQRSSARPWNVATR
jgi:transposase